MGTNYYYRYNLCDCCGRYDEEHVGKSSFGWSFSFHGTDEIRSFDDWLKFFESHPGQLFDEYDRPVTIKEFKELVEAKRDGFNHVLECRRKHYGYDEREWIDSQGNSFSAHDFS